MLLTAATTSATVVVAKDFAALCGEADLIFIGTVTDLESRWSDASQQAIETLVTFGDLTWLRGAVQQSVTLRFAGGEVDGLREQIAGMPHFALGERRIIFAREGRFVSPIVGFDQGALRVLDGSQGPVVVGADGAAPPGGDAQGSLRRGARRDDTTGATPPAGDDSPAMALDVFLDRVRRQLADAPGDAP